MSSKFLRTAEELKLGGEKKKAIISVYQHMHISLYSVAPLPCAAGMQTGRWEWKMDAWMCVCAGIGGCVPQAKCTGRVFLSESPGQQKHESAASRIYSQLIKLAFVLLLGHQLVSINTRWSTPTHTDTLPRWQRNTWTATAVMEWNWTLRKEGGQKKKVHGVAADN